MGALPTLGARLWKTSALDEKVVLWPGPRISGMKFRGLTYLFWVLLCFFILAMVGGKCKNNTCIDAACDATLAGTGTETLAQWFLVVRTVEGPFHEE